MMLSLENPYGHGRAKMMMLALLVVAGVATAPLRSTAAAGLKLDDVMREALVRNQDLMAARSQVAAAMARLKQAGRWPNTRLELSNETDKLFANEGEYSRSIGFTQDFPIAGRIGRTLDVARVDVARALTEVNESERRLLADVAKAFYTVVALDQQIALREKLIVIDQLLVTASVDRQKAGEVSEIDVNTATLELERLRQERTVLLGERAVVLKTLSGLSGFGANYELMIDTTLPKITPLPPLAELTGQALNQRPDLRLLALAADRALAEQELARASAWEDWSVSLDLQRDRTAITGAPIQSGDTLLGLRLTVPMPFFNRNRGAQAAAAADAMTAQQQLAALRLRIENDVAGRYAQVTRLLGALTSYRERTLPLSRRNAELARDAYSLGQLPITAVVQAQRQENDLNTSYAATLALYLQARAALNTATAAWLALMTHPVVTAAVQPGER